MEVWVNGLLPLIGVLLGGGITWFLERNRRHEEDRRRLYDQKWETFASFISAGDDLMIDMRLLRDFGDDMELRAMEPARDLFPSIRELNNRRSEFLDPYNRLTLVCSETVARALWFYVLNIDTLMTAMYSDSRDASSESRSERTTMTTRRRTWRNRFWKRATPINSGVVEEGATEDLSDDDDSPFYGAYGTTGTFAASLGKLPNMNFQE